MSNSKIGSGLAGGIILAALLGSASGASATPSACDAVAGNLIHNCGFETGSFSSWTKNTPSGPSNLTVTTPGYTGNDKATFAGGIGDTQPAVDTISQNIGGITPGLLYELSFEFMSVGDTTNGGFLGYADGAGYHSLVTFSNQPATSWILADYEFSTIYTNITLFIGGSDPQGSWSVDDFVLVPFTPTPVPEPVTLSLFGAGLAGIAALRRKKNGKSA